MWALEGCLATSPLSAPGLLVRLVGPEATCKGPESPRQGGVTAPLPQGAGSSDTKQGLGPLSSGTTAPPGGILDGAGSWVEGGLAQQRRGLPLPNHRLS